MWLENCFSVLTRSCFPRGPYTNTDGHSEPINYYTKKISTRSDTEYFRQVLTMYTHRNRSRQLFSAPINRDSNPRRRSSDLFLVGRRVSLELSIVSGYSCLPLLEIRVVVDFRESLRLDFQLSFLIHHFFFSKLFFLSLHKTRFGIFFIHNFSKLFRFSSSLLFSDTFHNFRFFLFLFESLRFLFVRFYFVLRQTKLFLSVFCGVLHGAGVTRIVALGLRVAVMGGGWVGAKSCYTIDYLENFVHS